MIGSSPDEIVLPCTQGTESSSIRTLPGLLQDRLRSAVTKTLQVLPAASASRVSVLVALVKAVQAGLADAR